MTSADRLNMLSPSTKGNLAFLFVVIFYILHQLTLHPNWVFFGGEMWAEMATNYYLIAKQNGLVERVIRTIKEQCVHRQRFETLQYASRVLGDWIGFYNQKRPHQALRMKTPNQVFEMFKLAA